jgi:uncharacterized protein (UPF0332 family)
MIKEKEGVIKYRIEKALGVLEEAEFLFQHKYWNTSVNKLYYSCFYAVSALLVSIDITAKTHSGALQMFGLHFVKTGKFDRKANAIYNKLFDMRQKADYEDELDYDEADVAPLLAPVRVLIIGIRDMLYPVA